MQPPLDVRLRDQSAAQINDFPVKLTIRIPLVAARAQGGAAGADVPYLTALRRVAGLLEGRGSVKVGNWRAAVSARGSLSGQCMPAARSWFTRASDCISAVEATSTLAECTGIAAGCMVAACTGAIPDTDSD